MIVDVAATATPAHGQSGSFQGGKEKASHNNTRWPKAPNSRI